MRFKYADLNFHQETQDCDVTFKIFPSIFSLTQKNLNEMTFTRQALMSFCSKSRKAPQIHIILLDRISDLHYISMHFFCDKNFLFSLISVGKILSWFEHSSVLEFMPLLVSGIFC